MKRNIWTWMTPILIVVGIIVGIPLLMFFENIVNEMKEEDSMKEVQAEEKDLYNGYGLVGDTKLSEVLLADENGIVSYEDRIFPHFSCTEDQITNTAKMAREFLKRTEFENLYIVPIPGRYVIEDAHEDDLKAYEKYVEKLSKAVDGTATLVDVLPKLQAHKDEYIFFRTEDSWTHRGAYYGSLELCKTLGLKPFSLDSYNEYMYTSFKGNFFSLYGDSFDEIEDVEGDKVFYYIHSEAEKQAKVEVEEDTWITVPTVSSSRLGLACFIEDIYLRAILPGNDKVQKEGKSLLLICNNQGKLLSQYFSNYYEEVHVINIEWNANLIEDISEILENCTIEDVVWAQNVDRMGNLAYSLAMMDLL